MRENAAAVLVFAVLIAVWELSCEWGDVPTWLLPSPSRILVELWGARAILPLHLYTTTIEVLLGFCLSVVVGVPLSILIVLSPLARKVVYPILVVLQSVPKVALAPILLIWIGYGTESKVLIASVTAFFPIVINTSAGMAAVPRELLELSRSLDSPSLKVFWKVRLPFAMPYLFSGMKVAMALALIGAVVGEFVGSDRGLGYLILTFSSTMNTALVFGAITLLAILGICLFYLVSGAERLFCPWYVGNDEGRL
ncbi:ABC transporter permease [Ancylobacter sp. MQZ15Z-1]|uniref:ABC transporter permease n=1 Tax=Ancylobacter mangrovi TaxID=2972472 RepID=A0A9X2PEP0_9HYPH|nr:ABC transporter permease [Ancylobacter mangrovi]MCS0494778.1 ABC transporter permease [Ancylobacter mangrovi]